MNRYKESEHKYTLIQLIFTSRNSIFIISNSIVHCAIRFYYSISLKFSTCIVYDILSYSKCCNGYSKFACSFSIHLSGYLAIHSRKQPEMNECIKFIILHMIFIECKRDTIWLSNQYRSIMILCGALIWSWIVFFSSYTNNIEFETFSAFGFSLYSPHLKVYCVLLENHKNDEFVHAYIEIEFCNLGQILNLYFQK